MPVPENHTECLFLEQGVPHGGLNPPEVSGWKSDRKVTLVAARLKVACSEDADRYVSLSRDIFTKTLQLGLVQQ